MTERFEWTDGDQKLLERYQAEEYPAFTGIGWAVKKLRAAVAELQRRDQHCPTCGPMAPTMEHGAECRDATPPTPAPAAGEQDALRCLNCGHSESEHAHTHVSKSCLANCFCSQWQPNGSDECDQCDGSGRYYIDGVEQECICAPAEPPHASGALADPTSLGAIRSPDKLLPSPDGVVLAAWESGGIIAECELDADKLRAALAALPEVMGEPQPGPAEGREFIDVVFDAPPGPESGRFVEVEDPAGRSIRVGEWIDRGNGLWALRIPREAPRAEAGDRERLDCSRELQQVKDSLSTLVDGARGTEHDRYGRSFLAACKALERIEAALGAGGREGK